MGSAYDSCPVKIIKKKNVLGEYKIMGIGMYSSDVILIPYFADRPLSITQRCTGKPAKEMQITKPVIYSVPSQCKIATSSWEIDGITRKIGPNVTIESPPYEILPSLNLTWPSRLPPRVLEKIDLTQFAALTVSDLPLLLSPVVDSPVVLWFQRHSMSSAVMIIIFLLLGTTGGILAYKRYAGRCRRSPKVVFSTLDTEEKVPLQVVPAIITKEPLTEPAPSAPFLTEKEPKPLYPMLN